MHIQAVHCMPTTTNAHEEVFRLLPNLHGLKKAWLLRVRTEQLWVVAIEAHPGLAL